MKLLLLSFFSVVSGVAFSQNNVLPAKIAGTKVLTCPAGVSGQSNGLSCKQIIVTIDTNIRKNPQFAYLSFEFPELTGSNQMDVLNGNQLFWVFDKNGKEVKLPGAEVLKLVKADLEAAGPVKMIVKVPYRLKTDKNQYTVRYRWESKDKTRNMDFVTVK